MTVSNSQPLRLVHGEHVHSNRRVGSRRRIELLERLGELGEVHVSTGAPFELCELVEIGLRFVELARRPGRGRAAQSEPRALHGIAEPESPQLDRRSLQDGPEPAQPRAGRGSESLAAFIVPEAVAAASRCAGPRRTRAARQASARTTVPAAPRATLVDPPGARWRASARAGRARWAARPAGRCPWPGTERPCAPARRTM